MSEHSANLRAAADFLGSTYDFLDVELLAAAAEIDRLTEENAELRADLANAAAWLRETFLAPTKGTSDPVNAALLDALACGQGWVRDGEHVPLDDVLNPTKETTDV